MLKLYPFQEQTIKTIEERKKIIVRTSQGLGKTVIACSFLKNHPDNTALIILPPIPDLILSWIKHLKAWANISQNEIQFIQRSKTLIDYSKRITIVPYSIFPKIQPLLDRKDILILDESHLIKSNRTKRTKAVMRYYHLFKPEYVIMLTATPIYNKPADLWTLLHICDPNKFNSFWKFAIEYCGAYKTKWGYWEFPTGVVSKKLKQLITPYIVSWTWKTAGVSIPPKIVKAISFGKASREIIDIEKELMDMEDGLRKENLKKKQRLLCGLMKVNKVTNYVVDYLIDKHEKIILFVWHRKVAEMYQQQLARHKIQNDIYYGGLSNNQKQRILNEFRNGNIQVLIANWSSLGIGVNLEFCNCCIFGELDYTISAIEQALFRIYRLSSNPEEPKMIYFPYLEESYESKVVNILLQKEKVNEFLLGKSDFKLPFEETRKI